MALRALPNRSKLNGSSRGVSDGTREAGRKLCMCARADWRWLVPAPNRWADTQGLSWSPCNGGGSDDRAWRVFAVGELYQGHSKQRGLAPPNRNQHLCVLRKYPPRPLRRRPPFRVIRVNSEDEVIARANNLLVGRAAYETAIRLYPRDTIQYRRRRGLSRGASRSPAPIVNHSLAPLFHLPKVLPWGLQTRARMKRHRGVANWARSTGK